jgi:hypothetical protein
MKILLMILALVFAMILFLMVAPMLAGSQEIASVTAEGRCMDFEVSISASGLGPGCWDVKLDVPGKVFDPVSEEWKSSFFYLENYVCYPDTAAVVKVTLDTPATPIASSVKLRQNNTVIEKDFTIVQECPRPLPDVWFILAVILIILLFGYSLTWWWRQGHIAGAQTPLTRAKKRSSKNKKRAGK